VRKDSPITLADVLKCGKRTTSAWGSEIDLGHPGAGILIFSRPRGSSRPTVSRPCATPATRPIWARWRTRRRCGDQQYRGPGVRGQGAAGPADGGQGQDHLDLAAAAESAILARRDLDPALIKKLRDFFVAYGKGTGPEADRQRKVMAGLTYRGFDPADNTYLDPVRAMIDSDALAEAARNGDQTKIQAGQKALARGRGAYGPNDPSVARRRR